MTEREKVIKGISCCVADPEGDRNCDACPYVEEQRKGGHCQNRMHTDAIALLKAGEPRVLTWEEMIEAGKRHDAVFVEEHENAYRKDTWAIAIEGVEPPERGYNFPGGVYFNAQELDGDIYDGDLYGVDGVLGWRAWTARPTEEQKKAVAW